MPPELTLHILAMSHPCMTAEAALRRKDLEYERVVLSPGPHTEEMAKIYGAARTTVPGLLVDGEPVHGSTAILPRLEEIKPDPPLYPDGRADEVREAELWADRELQDLGRRLTWGGLRFRPEAMGTYAGGEPLDPAGVDFALKFLHGTWNYHKITAERLASDLTGLPEKLAHVEALADDGLIGGEDPNAADLQIGATIRILLTVRDLEEHLADTAGERIARRWFSEYSGEIPAGAFPAGWVPAAA
ncbi:MAG: glutathione S-transferase N-terminal domain-containing protein [Actinomycetota bacterium]|nr:glutathione S-transferase N-terminal domain-containing protein [Actinomycetota bacterium]